MPKILPITVLQDANAISDTCHADNEPIFLTKNGYGDMVVMSMEKYEALVDTKRNLTAVETRMASSGAIEAGLVLENLKSRFVF